MLARELSVTQIESGKYSAPRLAIFYSELAMNFPHAVPVIQRARLLLTCQQAGVLNDRCASFQMAFVDLGNDMDN